MNEEIIVLKNNNTWAVTPFPQNKSSGYVRLNVRQMVIYIYAKLD